MLPLFKIINVGLLPLILWAGLIGSTASAQDTEEDIYEISIEHLMNLTLDKASVIGLPHPHAKGFWHIQYSNMIMPMTGFQRGRTKLTKDEVLDDPEFMGWAPDMHMNMHMLMLMWGPSDLVTLLAMVNYSTISMDSMIMRMGLMETPMPMEPSKGFQDLELMANFNAYNRDISSVLVNVGVALPLGSIDYTTVNMAFDTVRKPYPMQLGSGTIDPKFEVVYLGSTIKSSWGIGMKSTFRLYNNKHNYRLGNRYQIIAGAGHNWLKWFATTARIDYVSWGNIKGQDDGAIEIQPLWEMSSPNHTRIRGGTRIEASAGLVFEIPHGRFKGVAVIFDYRYPFYQNLKGVGMPIDYHFQIALQWILGEKHLD